MFDGLAIDAGDPDGRRAAPIAEFPDMAFCGGRWVCLPSYRLNAAHLRCPLCSSDADVTFAQTFRGEC